MSQNSQNLYCGLTYTIALIKKKMGCLKEMIGAKKWLGVLPALENVDRFNILILLVNEGQQTFSQIKEKRDLSPGNCAYHLNKLMKAELVSNSYQTPEEGSREYSYYEATPLGGEVIKRLLSP